MTTTVKRQDFETFCRSHTPPIHFENRRDGTYEVHWIPELSPLEVMTADLDWQRERNEKPRFTFDTDPVAAERMAYARGTRRGE